MRADPGLRPSLARGGQRHRLQPGRFRGLQYSGAGLGPWNGRVNRGERGYDNEVVVDHCGGWRIRVAHLSASQSPSASPWFADRSWAKSARPVSRPARICTTSSSPTATGCPSHRRRRDALRTTRPTGTPASTAGISSNVAVYRGSNSRFYIRRLDGGLLTEVAFGASGDLPAVGHYEDSAYDILALYRPSEGAFYLRWATVRNFIGRTPSVPGRSRSP
jgi:hypothetical protein